MKNIYRVVIAGDTFPTYTNLKYFIEGDVESLFGEKICNIFQNANLAICNMEGALTDNQERCNKIGPVIVAPTNAIFAYQKLGIDCCTLANNHITDGGHQGVLDTMTTLEKAGIRCIGAGRNEYEIKRSTVYDLGEIKVGLYNVCELMFNSPSSNKGGAWLYDEYVVCRELSELKSQCDYVIVVYHGGVEGFRYPSPETKKRFHRMADNGADVILSQHTHCVGCEEWYKGTYLLYGQGNFLFRDLLPGQTDEAILLEIRFSEGKTEVVKHMVRCVDKKFVRYNESQDFSAFYRRSEQAKDDDFVFKEFHELCQQNLWHYLSSCRNQSVIMEIVRKLFPSIYHCLLYKSYSVRNLMRMFLYMRSEQKREETIAGMEYMLDDVLNNRKKMKESKLDYLKTIYRLR